MVECDDPLYIKEAFAKDVVIQPVDSENPVEYDFFTFDNENTKWNTIRLSDMVDESDTPYTFNTWTTFYTTNTGQYGGSGGGGGGDATAANQVTGNNLLSSIDSKTPTLGQNDSANSVPVVLAVDQSGIPVSIGSPISVGSSSLPTGASTSALQTTQNNNLTTIASNTSSTAANTSASSSSLTTIVTNTGIIASDTDILMTGQGGQTAVGQNILLSTAGTGPQGVTNARSISIQIVPTGTVTSGTVIFEGSNDSINFTPIFLYDDSSITANPVSSYTPTTGLSRFFSGPTHFAQIRVRISVVIGGGGSLQAFSILRRHAFQPNVYTISQATAANLNVTGTMTSTSLVPGVAATNLGKAEDAVAASGDTGIMSLGVRRSTLAIQTSATGDYSELAVTDYGSQLMKSEDKHARTYSASAKTTPAIGATDFMFVPGNGTTTVYVTKIVISGLASIARLQDIQIIKRTTANTAGTSSSMSVAQHDSTDAVPSTTPITYTANPSGLGTSGGTLRQAFAALGLATSSDDNVLTFEFGDKGRPIVLRGTAQGLAVNLSGTATLSGDTISVSVEWFEI